MSGPALHALADLIIGARCAGCGRPQFGLCRHCRAALLAMRPLEVHRHLADFPRTVVAGEYGDVLQRVILMAKERGGLGQLPILGSLVARSVAGLLLRADASAAPVVLVPVPSARSAVVERGLDLTGTLARTAALRLRRTGLDVRVTAGLRLVRTPRDQAGLGRHERMLNLQGAFAWQGRPPRIAVVVDDVVTTGATVSAVSGALREAGVGLIGAAGIAHTVKRGGVR
ncbi:MAG: ComF family protein [Propionicimonas sp.]